MASINEYGAKRIEKTNEKWLTPVMFIDGLWLLPSSWDRRQTFVKRSPESIPGER